MDEVGELIQQSHTPLAYQEKRQRLLPILAEQVVLCCRRIPAYGDYVRKMRFPKRGFSAYSEVPYLPTSAFKNFDLCAVPPDKVVRVLTSSATSTGVPSRIYLDKATSFRQSQAMAATLTGTIGAGRRPYLMLDCKEVNNGAARLSARGAALRGFLPFASSIAYGLRTNGDRLDLDLGAIESFLAEHRRQRILVSGFTFIIWNHVINQLHARGSRFHHTEMDVFHSGGWKRLTEMRVDKGTFSAAVAGCFGCTPDAVRDFYGMVEQVGVVFVDCSAGNKHSPNFAEVVIRDPHTFDPVAPGETGLIEVLSVLPTSYPGQAIVTEDLGVLLGYDDCPCGKPGLYFRFQSRIERAEPRGCGDTIATTRILEETAPKQPVVDLPHAAGTVEVLVGSALEGNEPFVNLRRTLTSQMEDLAHLPVNAIVAILDCVGQRLASREFAQIEGIAFLSSWLRERNLRKLLLTDLGEKLGALDGPIDCNGLRLRAAPRGLVSHWIAGNVPTLTMFSWVLAILTKNASIIRVPKESGDLVRQFFTAVTEARVNTGGTLLSGELLLARASVIYFPSSDAACNREMSLAADARIVWGGLEAVRSIVALPRLEHCEDLIFGPKVSIGVIDRQTVKDRATLTTTVRAFVRDTLLFDQAACSSPQGIVVECSMEELEELAALFEEEFGKLSRRFAKGRIEPFTASRILQARAAFGLAEHTSVRASQDFSYTVLLQKDLALPPVVQARTLTLIAVDDLRAIVPLLSPKIQTIGVAISSQEKKKRFEEAAALRAVSRLVQPGTMHLYEIPWDGMYPLSRLVRWCRS